MLMMNSLQIEGREFLMAWENDGKHALGITQAQAPRRFQLTPVHGFDSAPEHLRQISGRVQETMMMPESEIVKTLSISEIGTSSHWESRLGSR